MQSIQGVYVYGVKIMKEEKWLNYKFFSSEERRGAFFIKANGFMGYYLIKIKLPADTFLDYLEPQSCSP